MTDDRGEPIADPTADSTPDPTAPPPTPAASDPHAERDRRPALERIGLAAVAVVMALLFGAVAVAAFIGGEYFLAAMGFVGCMMTLVVGGSTLLRG
jgi:hypothetical protein